MANALTVWRAFLIGLGRCPAALTCSPSPGAAVGQPATQKAGLTDPGMVPGRAPAAYDAPRQGMAGIE